MKRLGSALVSTALLSSVVVGAASAQSANNIHVVLNGVTQTFSQQPVQSNHVTLVPMRALFESLGAQIDYDTATGLITATKGADTIELKVNSTTAHKNGESITLETPAKLINGSAYVPLRFVGESFGAKVNWNKATSTIQIELPVQTESEQSSSNPAPISPVTTTEAIYETNTEPLAYKDAVALAVANSNKIKMQEQSLKVEDNKLEDAADKIDYIPTPGPDGNPEGKSAFNNYSQAQISYLVSKKKLEVAKEGLAFQVKKSYNAIINAIEDKRLADLNVTDAEWKLRIAQTKLSNQMASEYEVTQAQNTLAQTKAAQEVAAKALDEAYRTLNALIGYKADQKYEVTDLPKFEVFEDNVDAHIGRVQADSPTVWMAERGVEQAKLSVDYFTFYGQTTNAYENTKINVDLQKISVTDARKQLEDAIRQTYDQIKQLETQYTQLQASLTSATDALNVVQKRYELGMATQYEVFQAQLQLETLKQKISAIVTGLDSAKLAYEKPWIAAPQ
ncbi:stalk domain-containing protein [Paenibacillus macerans]|uniref:stalk domain-containing protein n=1 Tax=Paenibacillus macerans TaxID=44252 RepID=UPI0022E1D9FF|nr:stalk domain-containing protein [Paenibacillus macerans]MBS5911287.1 TolC family protein [Paenibacillus macerans]MEC0138346.1 stalk domain-containing protein [Paenibacillus macerans]MED4955596.1 stalk domain-containing protein [Paenibacillus macerans]